MGDDMEVAVMATRAEPTGSLRCTRILLQIILQQDKGCGSHHPLAEGCPRSVNSPKF